MRKIIVSLLLAFCIISTGFAQNLSKIDPELQQLINQKGDDLISVNIILKSQLDVNKLNSRNQIFSERSTKRSAVLKEFKKFSEASQSDVLSILQAETRSNGVQDIKCHWITNMINCKVSGDVVVQLSQHPDIAAIAYNKMEYMLFNEEFERMVTSENIAQNILNINADDVWSQGFTGKGVLVSILDTGVNLEHVDLKDHLWDGGEEYPNHGYNTLNNNHDLNDVFGHGTHCAGTICGDGTSGIKTGIAPEATLMCIKVLGDSGEGSVDAIISGVEFSVEHGADLLSLSLGSSFPNTYTSELYRSVFENLLEFDVLAVVAAGNDKGKMDEFPMPRNINAPGNCPPAWIHPDQRINGSGTTSIISVGAVDYEDQHAYFSSEGPVTWSGTSWNDYVLDLSTDLGPGWLDYDNNIFDTCLSGGSSFKWGVMFPPSKLKKYENGELTKVSMFDCAAHVGEIEIYQGGEYPEEGVLLHTQEYSCTGANAFVEFDLSMPLAIDHTKNLWIIMKTDDGRSSPAAACKTIHEPHGRYMGMMYGDIVLGEYTDWNDLCDYFYLQYTWMIRAFVSSDNGTVASLDREENEEFGLIRPDVCAPGMYIISSAHDKNDGFSVLSGTSMATPCVAGAVALMLEKNPELTPAQICEILETTAVKLSDKKNNKTGSGRIDILAAMEQMDNDPTECDAPNNLTAKTLTYNSVELSWETSSTADEYEVLRNNEKIATVTDTSYVDLQLDNDTQYCYTVKSICSFGISEPSKETCITTSNNESISELNSSFNIFPNPVDDKLVIETDAEILEVNIYDAFGRQQQTTSNQQSSINVSGLTSGVYFVKITTDKGEVTKLFIKK